MRFFSDWKFWIPFLITLVGVAVPLGQWYSVKTSQSLQLRLVSFTPVAPEKAAASGITVSIDGVAVEIPYLSVLQFVNNGTAPIPSKSFEAPLEIRVGNDAKIVRANVQKTDPTYLDPKLTFDSSSVKIEPLLLNAGESVTLTIITALKSPSFTVRSRIAGINEVDEIDQSNQKESPNVTKSIFRVIFCFILFLVGLLLQEVAHKRVVLGGWGVALMAGVVTGVGAGVLAQGVPELTSSGPLATALAASVFFLAWYLVKRFVKSHQKMTGNV